MTRGPEASAHVIPEAATAEWAALSSALVGRGPSPCETSAVPEAWWPPRPSALAPWELEAVRACRDCPVVAECLAYALAAGERDGVWGGLLPAERAGMAAA